MLSVRSLSRDSFDDRAAVLKLFLSANSYTQLIYGRPSGPQDVEDFFLGKPDTKEFSDKAVFGFYLESGLVGCADMIRAYPFPDTAWIGLLLISEDHQNKGYGVLALKMLTDIARGWQQERIQLSAISTNVKALSFWRRESFVELRRVPNEQFQGDAVVMERQIAQDF